MTPPSSAPPRKLRIAFVTPGFSADEDDACIPLQLGYVLRLAERHDVVVFALRYPFRREPYRVGNADVVPAGGGPVRGFRRLALLARCAASLRRADRDRRFDVIHAFFAHEPGLLAVRTARRLGIPSVVSVAGGELADVPEADYGGRRERVNRALVGRALAGADGVVAGSERGAAQVRELAGRRDVDVRILGVDAARFTPDGSTEQLEGRPAFVHAGSFGPVKDHASLLRAWARHVPGAPDARLHLVGERTDSPESASLVSSLGVSDTVRLHGPVRHERMPSIFRAAGAVVQSSLFEQTGMVAIEAAATGTPVGGTAVGVLPELVDASSLCRPGDVEGLVPVLRRLGETTETGKVGEALRGAVLERYSYEHTVPAWEAAYSRLVEERSRPG